MLKEFWCQKIIFLIWNSENSCLIIHKKKENVIKTMITAFPHSFQTIPWPLQTIFVFISFWYLVFSYLKQQQSEKNLLEPCWMSLMHSNGSFLRKITFFFLFLCWSISVCTQKKWNIESMDTNASLCSFWNIFWYQKNIFLSVLL